jgi:hypothetical protein
MTASEAPAFGHPDWNEYRHRVLDAVLDVEVTTQQPPALRPRLTSPALVSP